jgi:hypothetical protein
MHFQITGDSWSQGEWNGDPTDYKIVHQGIQQYLIDSGHTVINVGQGGFNNIESLDAVQNCNFDHLIFFYTDPLRQASELEIQLDLPFTIIENHRNYVHNRLVQIKSARHCKITVIGGCAKYLGSYQHLDYVVPSITELLVLNYKDSEYMTSREWETYFFKHQKKYSVEQKKQWLTVMSQAGIKYETWNNNKNLFWPDGLHVNRHGAKLLYDHLLKLWVNE